jgi:pimeloyl-ACP methyl ester carboxylesterase
MLQPTRPDLSSRVLSRVAATVDGVMLRAARALIDRTVMPPPARIAALRASAAFYVRPELLAEPRRFFAFLDRPLPAPPMTLRSAAGRGRFALTFPSRYEPADPAYQPLHARYVENHTAHVALWLHPEGEALGTVIGLHGFGTGYPRFDATALMVRPLHAAGLDVALSALPFHGARTPHSSRFSGQVLTAPNVPQMNEAIGQAVHDLAVLAAWLRERSDRPVGVIGLSLGGYVAALLAGLLPLDFVVPIAAPVDLGELAFRFMRASRYYRRRPDAGLGLEELRAAYGIHSPLAHAPIVPRERLLIVAGRGDRVVPSGHATRLLAHWGEPRIHWFSGSHLVPFGRSRILAAVWTFLRDLGVLAIARRT